MQANEICRYDLRSTPCDESQRQRCFSHKMTEAWLPSTSDINADSDHTWTGAGGMFAAHRNLQRKPDASRRELTGCFLAAWSRQQSSLPSSFPVFKTSSLPKREPLNLGWMMDGIMQTACGKWTGANLGILLLHHLEKTVSRRFRSWLEDLLYRARS